jgi:hypothetical protein
MGRIHSWPDTLYTADRGRVLLLGPFAPIAIPYLEQQQQPKKTIIYPQQNKTKKK